MKLMKLATWVAFGVWGLSAQAGAAVGKATAQVPQALPQAKLPAGELEDSRFNGPDGQKVTRMPGFSEPTIRYKRDPANQDNFIILQGDRNHPQFVEGKSYLVEEVLEATKPVSH